MARTTYFVGSEPDCVGGNYSLTTTGVDTNYVRTGFQTGGGQSVQLVLPTAAPENTPEGYWLHYRKHQNGMPFSGAETALWITDASGNASAGLVGVTYGSVKARVYANDGSYTESGATYDLYGDGTSGQTFDIDIHVYTVAGQAQMDVFKAGAQTATLSVTATSGYSRGAKTITLARPATGDVTPRRSEFIVANYDTRNLRVGTYIPAADGTYTDGTGTYADIDEVSPDGAAIVLAAVGDKRSYTLSKYGNPTLTGILAVAVNGYVASDGIGDVQAGLRIGGVDYFSADLGAGVALTKTSVIWSANPADGKLLPQNPATDIEVIYRAVA